MKRTFAIALIVLATWTATHSIAAQEFAAQADVPFYFSVGGTLLPAGTYTFRSPLAHTLLIQRGTQSTMAVFADSFALDPSAGSRLVFVRHGDKYFLKAVESSTASIHARLPQFHVPHSARAGSIAEVKNAPENASTVLVALK